MIVIMFVFVIVIIESGIMSRYIIGLDIMSQYIIELGVTLRHIAGLCLIF